MASILSFDLGKRRTGVAFAEEKSGIIFAMENRTHGNDDELLKELLNVIKERKATSIVVGLPRLPNGEEGEQAQWVRSIGAKLQHNFAGSIHYIDERFSSYDAGKKEADAKAAVSLLDTFLEQSKRSIDK